MAWGFQYKTVAFCWVKQYPNGGIISNLGRWTMGGVELCLLGTKGHPKRIRKDIKQVLLDKRENHSEKPFAVRELIVQLMGDLPRIELFARKDPRQTLDGKNTFDGWAVWGDDLSSSESSR